MEPKRRKQQTGQEDPRQRGDAGVSSPAAAMGEGASDQPSHGSSRQRGSAGGRELRRARIVITVKRTEDYERWLEENPLQAIIAGDGDDDEAGTEAGTV